MKLIYGSVSYVTMIGALLGMGASALGNIIVLPKTRSYFVGQLLIVLIIFIALRFSKKEVLTNNGTKNNNAN